MFARKINQKNKDDILLYLYSVSISGMPDIEMLRNKLMQKNLDKQLRKFITNTIYDMENRGVKFHDALLKNGIITKVEHGIVVNASSQSEGFHAIINNFKKNTQLRNILLSLLLMPSIYVVALYFTYDPIVNWISGINAPIENALNVKISLPETYQSKTPYTILLFGYFSTLTSILLFFLGTKKYFPKFHNKIFIISSNEETKQIVFNIFNLVKAGVPIPVIFESLKDSGTSSTSIYFYNKIYSDMRDRGVCDFVKTGADELALDDMSMNYLNQGYATRSEKSFRNYLIAVKNEISNRITNKLDKYEEVAPVAGMVLSSFIIAIPLFDLATYFTVGMMSELSSAVKGMQP